MIKVKTVIFNFSTYILCATIKIILFKYLKRENKEADPEFLTCKHIYVYIECWCEIYALKKATCLYFDI